MAESFIVVLGYAKPRAAATLLASIKAMEIGNSDVQRISALQRRPHALLASVAMAPWRARLIRRDEGTSLFSCCFFLFFSRITSNVVSDVSLFPSQTRVYIQFFFGLQVYHVLYQAPAVHSLTNCVIPNC